VCAESEVETKTRLPGKSQEVIVQRISRHSAQ
jgi:hypothetical protein